MNRRNFLMSAGCAPLAAQAQPARPNVIIILSDDQGYGDFSCHGNPRLKTPNLDRLHAESVRMTDFHVSAMCTPTRSQLMTGRDALANGAMNVSSGRTMLRTDVPTMAEIFADSGYRTGIFGKWHLGDAHPYRPEDRGFQEAVWFPSSHIGSAPDAWNNDCFNDRYRHNRRLERYKGYCTDVFFGEARRWIRSGRQPFFAYIPSNAPHGPLFVEDRYRAPYRDLPAGLASFFGMIANLDENVGRLDAMLGETGLQDNTILIYMNDNGGTQGVKLFNAGMRGNKVGLYDGGHRAACFIRWPKGGLPRGKDIGELAEVQDILPTLVEMCGLKVPAGARFDGTSLAPLISGRTAALPDRMLVVQYSRMNDPVPRKGDAAVLWRKWRLVSGKELYDVGKDPAQESDLAAQHPDVVARMTAHYEEWWKRVEPGLGTYQACHIGAVEENPTLLSPTEWADVFLDQGNQIRRGERKNGFWLIEVERKGEYTFTLRRWAAGVDVPMRAPLPEHQDRGEDGKYIAGVALPIAKARLTVGPYDVARAVGAQDREVTFNLRLNKGRTKLQSWFYDDGGKEIGGAYYVYVEYKGPPGG